MEMMVVSAITARSAYNVTGQGYAIKGQILEDGSLVGCSILFFKQPSALPSSRRA
jgi:hypothetical protein